MSNEGKYAQVPPVAAMATPEKGGGAEFLMISGMQI